MIISWAFFPSEWSLSEGNCILTVQVKWILFFLLIFMQDCLNQIIFPFKSIGKLISNQDLLLINHINIISRPVFQTYLKPIFGIFAFYEINNYAVDEGQLIPTSQILHGQHWLCYHLSVTILSISTVIWLEKRIVYGFWWRLVVGYASCAIHEGLSANLKS